MIKKEVRDILKKMLGSHCIDISQTFKIIRCLNGQTGQLGNVVADIIEKAYMNGFITEYDAIFLIEEMVDEENNDRNNNSLSLPFTGFTGIRDFDHPLPNRPITVMYGVSTTDEIQYDNDSLIGSLVSYIQNDSFTSSTSTDTESGNIVQEKNEKPLTKSKKNKKPFNLQ